MRKVRRYPYALCIGIGILLVSLVGCSSKADSTASKGSQNSKDAVVQSQLFSEDAIQKRTYQSYLTDKAYKADLYVNEKDWYDDKGKLGLANEIQKNEDTSRILYQQIFPEALIQKCSTEELLKLTLSTYAMTTFALEDSMEAGLNHVLNNQNGFDALSKRSDFLKVLYTYYMGLDPKNEKDHTSLYLSTCVVESILGQDDFYDLLTDVEKKDLSEKAAKFEAVRKEAGKELYSRYGFISG